MITAKSVYKYNCSVCYHQVCYNAVVLANDRPFIVLDSVLHGGKDDPHIDCLLLHVDTDGKKEAGGDTSRTPSFVTCLTWLTLAPGILSQNSSHTNIIINCSVNVGDLFYFLPVWLGKDFISFA